MRMRKKKHGIERINACSHLLIDNSTEYKGNLHKLFKNDNPIFLEIGCGKGSFISGMAKKYPDVNFIAMEKISDVIVHAIERINVENLENVRFIIGDAKNLPEYFGKGDIQCIYLNFSDPWPKAKHAKRRLTYKTFLDIYKSILTDKGALFFKTDNRPLFDFSIESLTENGFKLENLTNDLHNSILNEVNIVTEYETIFSEKGFTINSVEAYLI